MRRGGLMVTDPIVEEVHQARAKLLEKHGGNFKSLVAYLRRCEQKHPERLVTKEDLAKMDEKKKVFVGTGM
jgi:hypothetical protein